MGEWKETETARGRNFETDTRTEHNRQEERQRDTADRS